MTELFLLIDQHNNYLDKDGQWIPPAEAKSSANSLFRTPLKDEAINQKVEYIVKNPDVRVTITSAPAGNKGVPILETVTDGELDLGFQTETLESDPETAAKTVSETSNQASNDTLSETTAEETADLMEDNPREAVA